MCETLCSFRVLIRCSIAGTISLPFLMMSWQSFRRNRFFVKVDLNYPQNPYLDCEDDHFVQTELFCNNCWVVSLWQLLRYHIENIVPNVNTEYLSIHTDACRKVTLVLPRNNLNINTWQGGLSVLSCSIIDNF